MTTTAQPRPARTRGARLGSAAGSVLLLVVLLLSVAYLLPSLLGYQRYILTGGSMTGTYDQYSIVYEEVVPTSDLRVGDVITYLPPASSGVPTLVTHRIVRIHPGSDGRPVYRTKGDANDARDPWTFTLDSPEQPVVRYAVPHAGRVFLFLADPHHRTLLIGIPAGLVALLSLGEAARNLRAARRDRDAGARPQAGTTPAPAPAAAPAVATVTVAH